MLKTHPAQAANLLKCLERTFQLDVKPPDLKDAGASVAAQLVERFPLTRAANTSPEKRRQQDIANVLQEALEEEAADRQRTPIVVALGLLLASLDSPRE